MDIDKDAVDSNGGSEAEESEDTDSPPAVKKSRKERKLYAYFSVYTFAMYLSPEFYLIQRFKSCCIFIYLLGNKDLFKINLAFFVIRD